MIISGFSRNGINLTQPSTLRGSAGRRQWQPTGRLTDQVGWLGLRVGDCLALSLHSLYEPSELWQWPGHDDSAINIVTHWYYS